MKYEATLLTYKAYNKMLTEETQKYFITKKYSFGCKYMCTTLHISSKKYEILWNHLFNGTLHLFEKELKTIFWQLIIIKYSRIT